MGGMESSVFIDQTLISEIEFRLRHFYVIKGKTKREEYSVYHFIKYDR